MRVRTAKPPDADAVCELHRASIRACGPTTYDDEQVAAWAKGCHPSGYVDAMADNTLTFLVAEADADLCGFGSVKFTPPEWARRAEAELTGLYVHPDHVLNGVGTRLLARLELHARNQGVERLAVTASLNAVSYYRDQGYRQEGSHTHEFSTDTGVTGTVVELTRAL